MSSAADLYSVRSSGKLTLKGEKKKKHKKDKKSKKRKHEDIEENAKKDNYNKDRECHGGWWYATEFKHISGAIAIEFSEHCYVKALDDGSFTLGPKHDEGQGPDPEEILMAIKINEDKIALKSGFDKYLKVNQIGQVKGISDAVGPMEQFEPIFQDGKLALLGSNHKFMSINESDEIIECSKQKADSATEMIKIRSSAQKEEDKEVYIPTEERGKIGDVELNYVRKFQKFQDHKIRLNMEDRADLVRAKKEGDLHEALLDRRAKMKADRYCK